MGIFPLAQIVLVDDIENHWVSHFLCFSLLVVYQLQHKPSLLNHTFFEYYYYYMTQCNLYYYYYILLITITPCLVLYSQIFKVVMNIMNSNTIVYATYRVQLHLNPSVNHTLCKTMYVCILYYTMTTERCGYGTETDI